MSVIERFRKLLDERAVEWDYGITGSTTTRFSVNGIDLTFTPMRDGLVCSTILTPEQAIAATLGRGTCEVEESWHGESEMVEYHCTACDEYIAVEVVKPNGAQPPNFCPNCGRKVVAE